MKFFDIEYDYDVYPLFQEYIETGKGLNKWLKAILEQESRFPRNYIKIHGLENHDSKRVASTIKDGNKLRNLNALMFFLKGTTFIYAGQEACDEKLESLFDIDLIDWSNLNKHGIEDLIKTLTTIKKHPLFREGIFNIEFHDEEIAHITYENENQLMECIANLGNLNIEINSKARDREYINLINEQNIIVNNGKLRLNSDPIVILSRK